MSRSLASILLALAAVLGMTPHAWAQLEEDAYGGNSSWARQEAADSVTAKQSSSSRHSAAGELSGCGWSCYPPDYSCYPSGYAYRGNTQVLVVLRDPELDRKAQASLPPSYTDFHDCQYDVYVTGNSPSARPNAVAAERYPCCGDPEFDTIRTVDNAQVWQSLTVLVDHAVTACQSQVQSMQSVAADGIDAVVQVAARAADGLTDLIERGMAERKTASVERLHIRQLEDIRIPGRYVASKGLVLRSVELYFAAAAQVHEWKRSCDLYVDDAVLAMGHNVACLEPALPSHALLTLEGQAAEMERLVEQSLQPQHWNGEKLAEVPVASLEQLKEMAPIASISRALRLALYRSFDGTIEVSRRIDQQRTE